MDAEAIKLIGSGGIAAALLALIYLVGMRLVGAIDRISIKVDEHTVADLAHHAEVREAIVRVEAKLDERGSTASVPRLQSIRRPPTER